MISNKRSKAIAFLLLLLPFQYIYSERYYVIPAGTGIGTSWAEAMGDLQAAINGATSGDEIWVKTGTYKPHASDRAVAFTLVSGVKIYGGFQGAEIKLEDRILNDVDGNGKIEDWEFLFPSILSGEIQDDGQLENNSQHVVKIPDGADVNTSLNGFTITDGYNDVSTSTSQGSIVGGAGILAFGGHIDKCWVMYSKSLNDEVCYAAGIFAANVKISQTKIEQTHSKSITGKVIGGGLYTNNCIVIGCKIISNSATSQANQNTSGGGIYLHNSNMIDCDISNCSASAGVSGYGGGVYSFTSTMINSVVYNCEASMQGGGVLLDGDGYTTNCVIANNRVTETGSVGGGVFMADASIIFNSVVWKNFSAGTTNQFRLSDTGVANNCAVQGEEITGNSNIAISNENTGSVDGTLYPFFETPTGFVGVTGEDVNKQNELLIADWNIKEASSLIEKGDNKGFTEALYVDLNGDGDKSDNVDNFSDLDGENRLFNYKVDIGAFENAFIDLLLPTAQPLEYGSLLGAVILTGGSAKDNRDGSFLEGAYSFTKPSFKPNYSSEAQKFRVAFTPVDNVNYPVHYDTVSVMINIKTLTLSGLTADDKTYDATTDVSFSGTATLEGVVTGDEVSLSTGDVTASFIDKNVGDDKAVKFTGYTLNGAEKDNYILSLTGTTASITPKSVSVSALIARNKVYDGTATADYEKTHTLTGVLSGDGLSLDLTTAKAEFDNKQAGFSKVVRYSGFTLAGSDKNNYTLLQPINSSADVSKKAVNVVGVTSDDKVYDGTINATIVGAAVASGLIHEDDVLFNVSSAEALFDTKNVGVDKDVLFSGYVLTGADALNYVLTQPLATTASISKKELSQSGISITTKTYDGGANANLSGTATLIGVVDGEDVSLNTTGILANYEDANVGTNKSVTITGYSLIGVDIGNYAWTAPILNGDITPANISIVADGASKKYSETDPAFTYQVTSGGLIGADTFSGSLSRTSGEDAKSYPINQGSLTLSNNYVINFTGSTFTILQADNIISFSLESPIDFEQDKQVTLNATASSAETVQYTSSDESIASIPHNSSTLIIKSYGTITITASGKSNENFNVAEDVILSLQIKLPVVALRKDAQSNIVLIDNSNKLFVKYQWYKNESLISGATKQYYYDVAGLNGSYYCEVFTEEDKFVSNTVSTSSTKSVSIYPSPAMVGTTFNIKLDGFTNSSLQDATVDVYSITGDLVKQIHNPENINNLSVDKPGVYIVKINGNNRLVKKVIVK